jgi:hypothetical protein
MAGPFLSWRWLIPGCVALALALAAPARADEDGGQKKGKGKGPKAEAAKSTIIQLDASKLPPDLLKQLMKYTAEGQKKGNPKSPAKDKDKGKKSLPPGLANKAANHPGRVNWLREHSQAEPAKGKGKKGGDEGKKKGGPKSAVKDKGKTSLPPGLAKKAANHPGRVNWLREHSQVEPKKGKDKKGGDDPKKKGGPKKKDKDKES